MNKQQLHITLVQCAKIKTNNSSDERAVSGQMLKQTEGCCSQISRRVRKLKRKLCPRQIKH